MTYTEQNDDTHEMDNLTDIHDNQVLPKVVEESDSTNIDMVDGGKLYPIACRTKFYDMIFSIISPFVYIGIPYNFCFPNNYKIYNSYIMKGYTFTILLASHILLGFWTVRLMVEMASVSVLTDHHVQEVFRLFYIFAGVVSLDIIWYHRGHIKSLLSEKLDYCPLAANEKYKTLQAKDVSYFKFYRYKTLILKTLSRILCILLLAYFIYLVTIIIIAYTNSDPNDNDMSRIFDLISVYAIYFFVSDAIFLIALIWTLKYQILHLNLFVTNLTTLSSTPDLNDIELIKNWYQNLKATARKMDNIFWFYLPVYLGIFFFGIIYFVSKIIDKLTMLKDVTNNQVVILASVVLLLNIILFYSLKELTDVHAYSNDTKSIVYSYVLNSKLEDRSTVFFEEINFVANLSLSTPVKFSLFGNIDLTKSYMAHIAVLIYSYVIIFHQLSKQFIKNSAA